MSVRDDPGTNGLKSQKADLSQKWLMWGKWKILFRNKSDPAACIWLKTSIARVLIQINYDTFWLNKTRKFTIFRMCLNVSVSITLYTDTFGIYLKGPQCTDNICFFSPNYFCFLASKMEILVPPSNPSQDPHTAGFPVSQLLFSSWPSVQLGGFFQTLCRSIWSVFTIICTLHNNGKKNFKCVTENKIWGNLRTQKRRSQDEKNYVISNTKCNHLYSLIQRHSWQHQHGHMTLERAENVS